MRTTRWVAVLLALALVLSLVPTAALGASGPSGSFIDVQGTDYDLPVSALYDLGVVNGTSPTTFSPGAPVTRAQMAAFLVRTLKLTGEVSQQTTVKFTDVPRSYWGFGEVGVAAQYGIVKGASTTEFLPEIKVTYAQATVMTLRALGYERDGMNYPTDYVVAASELGLLTDLKWSLDGEMSRGEVAVLLANAVFKVPHKQYGKTLSQVTFQKVYNLDVSSSGDALLAGSTKLQATGRDAYGNEITLSNVDWAVLSGSATVDAKGNLTAQNGNVTVEASLNGRHARHTYRIVSSLAIAADTSGAKPGESIALKAVDGDKRSQQINGVTWTVQSGPGRIDADGKLTFTGAGAVVVKASANGLSATANFYAANGMLVSPANPTATPGDVIQFIVKQEDGTPFTGAVQWSVEGAGAISADGKFTASGGTGPTVVKAKAGSLTGSTAVTTVTRIDVTPGPSVGVMKTKSLNFSAKAYTSSGAQISVPITWTITPGLGILGADGTFVATGSGSGRVTATYGQLTQMVDVSVSGDPYTVILTANRTSIPANGKSAVTLTATLKDINGVTVATDAPVQFMLDNTTRGSLSAQTVQTQNGVATTTFTPSNQSGIVRVSAAAANMAIQYGYLDLTTYAPVPARISLVANPNPVAAAAGSRTSIAAILTDNEGAEIINNTGTSQTVTLSYSGNTTATLSSTVLYINPGQSRAEATFYAGTAGNVTITGATNLPVDGLTVSVLNVGPAAKVAIRPNISEVAADGSAEMVVYAEIQDTMGVTRTQDFAQAVTLNGTYQDGTAMPALTATTQNGVATFRVRSRTAGAISFRAASSGMQSAAVVGTFKAGIAAKVTLSVLPTSNIAADGISVVRLHAEITDSNGNRVPTAGGIVTFSRTTNGNATTLPATTAVSSNNGVAELVLTSSIYPGTDVFKASVAGLTDSNSVSLYSRITGLPYQVVGDVINNAVPVGTSVLVKVYVKDSLDQIVTSATGRVIRLLPNSPTAKVTGTGLTESGVASFLVTDTKAGNMTVTITGDGLKSDTRSVTFYSSTAAQVVLQLSTPEMSADNGQSSTQLTAEVQDAFGNKVSQYVPVTLTMDNQTVTRMSSSTLYGGGSVMLSSTQVAGNVTISGTASIPVVPVTLTTFVPGAPAKLRVDPVTTGNVGEQLTFRVRIIDTNGHVLTSVNTGGTISALGVTLTGVNGQTSTITNNNQSGLVNFFANGTTAGATNVTAGVATFTYSNSRAETATIIPVFYYNGVALQVETGTISTRPGNAVQLLVRSGRRGLSYSTADSTMVEAILVDANQNPVPYPDGDTFTFSLNTDLYLTINSSATVTAPNGQASVQIGSKLRSSGGITEVVVRSAKTGLTGTVTLMTDAPPNAPMVFVNNASGTDGIIHTYDMSMRVTVSMEARNTAQTVTVFVNGFQVTLYNTPYGGAASNSVSAGQQVFVGYVLRSDMGGPGSKNVTVMLRNDVGMSPMSNTQTIMVE